MKEYIRKEILGPILLIIIFSLIMMRSAGNLGKTEAYTYHNRILDKDTEIALLMIDFVQSLDKRNQEEMLEKLHILQRKIDDFLKELSTMEDFHGYNRLRDATIDLLKFYKSIAEKEYVEAITILSSEEMFISQADAGRLEEINEYIVNGEAEYMGKVQAAQKEFAKIYGFKVMSQTYQEYIKRGYGDRNKYL